MAPHKPKPVVLSLENVVQLLKSGCWQLTRRPDVPPKNAAYLRPIRVVTARQEDNRLYLRLGDGCDKNIVFVVTSAEHPLHDYGLINIKDSRLPGLYGFRFAA